MPVLRDANASKVGQAHHEFLQTGGHDDLSRQTYVSALRMHILNQIGGGMRDVFERRVKPNFKKEQGREPQDQHEVRRAMLKDHYGRTWSSMMRACQEMVWDSVIPVIERAQPDLNDRIRGINARHGSVELNPDVNLPRYLTATDIHIMPGNYYTERTSDDATQAALYDRGVYVYQNGFAGPYCDGIGRSMAEFIKQRFPDLRPKRILDVGCTVGHNTVPFTEVFPDAEVHAVDVAAPNIRYAHARSESLEKPIHFHQMNAENMTFEDNSFDLVLSVIMFHETSRVGLRNILRECHRVLKPGGMTIHCELPRTTDMDIFDAFYIDWDAYYNNEPYYAAYTKTDMKEVMEKAGFNGETYVQDMIPDFYMSSAEEFLAAAVGNKKKDDAHGRWGETVKWTTYSAWK